MNRLLPILIWLLISLVCLPVTQARENDWPRTLPLKQGMVTIYSLQVDEQQGDTIKFRAALAYRATPSSEPVFGAGWFESTVDIDSAKRIVHPKDLKITDTRFPAGTDGIQAELAQVLAQQSPDWNLDFSLDELESALNTAEAESLAVNTKPPKIYYRDHPALLISIDGEPVLREIENSSYQAVINTPYPLIFDGRHYYLNAAKDVWFRANGATGPYQLDQNPPKTIAAMVDPEKTDELVEQPAEPVTRANAPEIVVSTEPAELIVTEGPAAFVPLVDDLLVLQNSSDDVFMHVSSQDFFIVLAGRWYRASSLDGPWVYEPADNLPNAFANIPQDSEQADSRVYVAGTDEAQEAVLDAYIPQTAAVARGEADIEVSYDGAPVYAAVDGTDLVYIQNTGSTVLVAGGLYYLVENGVWYVSSSPNGPWQVSDHRPQQVDTILPSSPVYNTKYVRVYDSTPEVVYVGYTPGYTGSYVYRNTIIYGSGWYYSPWVSPYYYYPRYSTWGFNVAYNPWSGWNFGLSWGWGPFSFSYYSGGYWHHNHYWHHRHYGRWGPGRYRHRPAHHGHGYNRYGHNNRRYNDYGHDGRYRDSRDRNGRDRDGRNRSAHDYGSNDRYGDTLARNRNLYRDDSQRASIRDTWDNHPRTPTQRSGTTTQPRYIAASGNRQKNHTSKDKVGRSRIGPVSSSDLRKKANLRDVNLEASRTRLLADNSGEVYRGSSRVRQREAADNRNNPSSKKARSKTMPVTARPQVSKRSTNRTGASPIAKSTKSSRAVTGDNRSTKRLTNDPSVRRQSRAGNTSSRSSQLKKTDRQRISPVTSIATNNTRPKKSNNQVNTRPRTSREPAPVRQQRSPPGRDASRQTRPVNISKNSRQAPPRPNPVQAQTRSRSQPAPPSKNTGRNKVEPVKSKPQKYVSRPAAKNRNSDNTGNRRSGSRKAGDR
jgi:hypothetical protein